MPIPKKIHLLSVNCESVKTLATNLQTVFPFSFTNGRQMDMALVCHMPTTILKDLTVTTFVEFNASAAAIFYSSSASTLT